MTPKRRPRCADYNNPPRKNPAATAISGAAAYNLPPDKTEKLKKSCREVLNTATFPKMRKNTEKICVKLSIDTPRALWQNVGKNLIV